ncbi:MAG: hypothetical protein QM752_06185 [Gammaproteobacteria bacterium]
MCYKVYAIIVVVIAAIIALAVSALPQEKLMGLYYVSRFVEVMIPILGVGALIKYLFSCCRCNRADRTNQI